MPEPKKGDLVRSAKTTYKIERILNSGAEGTPCLASTSTGERVFLKYITRVTPASDRLQSLAFRKWQESLAQKLRSIPSFVSQPVELFEFENHYWRADRLVDGSSLESRLDAAQRDPNAYPQKERERDALVLAYTVAQIHENGVVHSDLKPDNVMVQQAMPPRCIIVDFDIGFLAGTTPLETGWTPGYGAPEHIAPSLGALSPAVDIFSLGCILYELLLYTLPWPDNWEEDCVRGRCIDPIRAAAASGLKYPEPLLRTLRDCLTVNPSARPDAKSVHLALLNGLSTPPAPPPTAIALLGDGGRITLPRDGAVTIGRDQFDGWIQAGTVSREHIRIGRDHRGWCLWHLSQTNATIVMRGSGQEEIRKPGYRCDIQLGDRLRLGQLEVQVVSA